MKLEKIAQQGYESPKSSTSSDEPDNWVSFADLGKALMPGKTHLCKHDHSCMYNALRGFVRSFLYALGLKLFANNIGYEKMHSLRYYTTPNAKYRYVIVYSHSHLLSNDVQYR